MNNFTKAYQQLNIAQKSAVDTIEGPVLVIAGPGTGKTHVLTARIANIMARTDTSPHNILCLTFTDSAAQTMRARLTGMVGTTAHAVTFSTYHAFGSELIRRFPEFFTDLSDARPVDELGIATILTDLLNKAPYTNPLKRSQASIRDIKETISECKRALLTPDQLRKVALANRQFISETNHEVSALLSTFKRMEKSSVVLFEQLAEKTRGTIPEEQSVVRHIGFLWQEELEAALQAVRDSGKTTALTEWKNSWLAKNSENMFVVDGMRTVQRLDAMADMYEQYLQALSAGGLYDYDDMILQAIKGLEAYPELRYTLQEQYLYLLLDEFQDTNEAQMCLIELLTDNPVNEGRPNVMAVGDDDQAIFAFQGAHYSHMLRFTEIYREVTVISLTENFRSHEEVLLLADGVAGQIEQRLHEQLYQTNKRLSAANKSLPKKATIEYREFNSDVAQFAWIADEVKRLVEKNIPPSEIAIIAPQHKYLEPMVAYLHQVGLPVRYEKRENILDDPVIKQFCRMTELILALQENDQSLADSLWPEVLSFPYWQIPTNDIWRLSWRAYDSHATWTQLMMELPQLRAIALFFVRLGLLADTENLETILDYLTGVQPVELLAPDIPLYHAPMYTYFLKSEIQFWNLLSNLTVLREKLRGYKIEADEPLSLLDFRQFVQAYKNAGIKLLNTSPYYEATEAVQLMTVYKAKGQEFTAVFVLACLEEVWGSKARGQSSRILLPRNLQFIRYGGLTDDERIRLLFVAITRAKHHLYLTSYANSYDGKQTTRLSYLDNLVTHGPDSTTLVPLSAKQSDASPPTIANLSTYWQNAHSAGNTSPALRALLEDRLQKYMLSPTHLNAFTDVIYGGPEQFYMNTILRFPKAPTPSGQYGNTIHETLEWLHIYNRREGKLPSASQLHKYFTQRLAAKRLSAHHYQQLIERGHSALTTYMQQRSHTVSAHNECEKPFYDEGVFIDKAHLSGKIDKLLIDKKNKTVVIVDYKTGKSFSRWNNSEAKLHKYRQQLYFYKILVEGSQTFSGYKVKDTYLEFVEPNDEGEIVELHLEFDDAYMKRVKSLINSTWQAIQKLHFPPIGDYPATTKGIIAFEDDLLGGKI